MTLLFMLLTVVLIQAMVAGINLAIPSLAAGGLHPSHTDLVWVVDAYVLVFAALLIPLGALGDRIGRKRAVVWGLALFAASCTISALAPNVLTLQLGRALGGAAAALAQPATLGVLLAVYKESRTRAVTLWTVALGVGGVAGNLIAGAVLRSAAWPWFFWAFVPAAVVVLVLTALLVPQVPRFPSRTSAVDTVVLAGGLFALLFGIIEGPEHGWASSPVLGAFGLALALLAAFVWRGRHGRSPLLDPRVFAIASVRAGTLGVAASFLALFGLFFVNAQFLQDVKGYSPLLTGFAILPLAVGMLVMSALAGRTGAGRVTIAAGMGLIALGLVLLSFVRAGTPYPWYALCLLVTAAGLGLCAPALTTGVLRGLPPARAGLGSGLNSAAREVGAALGVAVIGSVLNSTTSFTAGIAIGYRVLAALLLVFGAVAVAMWPRGDAAPVGEAVPGGERVRVPGAEAGTAGLGEDLPETPGGGVVTGVAR
ncbi:MFS transporter [Dactylosporangium vinaceum]|uniref:MFS transporter n=1 Tax=Dactylosporangium vinaceum TaxID=53362 RepID=A0ABV5M6H5_9ACTN|nr:MFS transporter [Dactylosporangium vinaceum]